MEQAAFVKHLADRVAVATGARVDMDGLTLRLFTKDGNYLHGVNVEGLWAGCGKAPVACGGVVDRYVENLSANLADHMKPIEPAKLRISVQPKAELERMMAVRAQWPPIARPLAGDLSLVLVADGDRVMRLLHRGDLRKLKVTESRAFEIAAANLRRELKPLGSAIQPVGGDGIGFLEDDVYAASRLALLKEWKELAAALGGSLVVAVPAANILAYGSGSSDAAVDKLRRFAKFGVAKSRRPLSAQLLRWTPKGWEVVP